MKGNRFFLAAIAVSVMIAPAMAAEETQVPDETKPGQTRGITLGSPVPNTPSLPRAIEAPAPVKPVVKAVTKPVVKQPVVATTTKQKVKAPVIAKQKAATPSIAVKEKPAPVVASTPAANCVPVSASSVITAVLDRPGEHPKYKVGEKLVISVAASQDCNLVVFNYDSNNNLTQIFPNDFQTNGFVKSGETLQIGGPDSPFDYSVTGKGGTEKIFVYAYPTGSTTPLTIAMNQLSGTPFRGTEMKPEDYRNMVNNSTVFFARSVAVTAKKGAQLTAASTPQATPNKIELSFSVDK